MDMFRGFFLAMDRKKILSGGCGGEIGVFRGRTGKEIQAADTINLLIALLSKDRDRVGKSGGGRGRGEDDGGDGRGARKSDIPPMSHKRRSMAEPPTMASRSIGARLAWGGELIQISV